MNFIFIFENLYICIFKVTQIFMKYSYFELKTYLVKTKLVWQEECSFKRNSSPHCVDSTERRLRVSICCLGHPNEQRPRQVFKSMGGESNRLSRYFNFNFFFCSSFLIPQILEIPIAPLAPTLTMALNERPEHERVNVERLRQTFCRAW